MRKSALFGIVMAVVVSAAMFFSSADCWAAGEVRLSKKTEAEIAGTFIVMGENIGRSFNQSDLTNDDLIDFGVSAASFDPEQRYADGSYLLPEKYVSAAVKKYFNLLVRHGSTEHVKYTNGSYEMRGGERGESFVAIITDKKSINANYIEVHVDIVDPTENNKFYRKEIATFMKVKEKGKERWFVYTYQILK